VVADEFDWSVLVVLDVEVWLVVSVAVLDAGALVDGVLEEAAPVCALSLAAVPVVELGALLAAAPVVSAGVVVVVAGVLCGELLVEPAPVDDVWSVTGGWPAAFGGFDVGAVLCAFGSVVPVVDCVLVALDCPFWSAGLVVVAVLVLLC
jgi:hypothetical protein